jgi:transposase InsO family protein
MMEQHWITIRVVIDLTGWHPQYVRRLAREGQLQHRPSKSVRSSGRAQREYALSSLPVEAQLKFLKQPLLSGPACTALALRPDPNQSNLFASLPEVTGPERLNFSARQNAQALKRLEAIAPLVEFRSRSQRSRPTFRTVGGVAVRSMNSLAGYLADQHHPSPRTLWNWYGQYRKLGYAGLVDRVRSDKGKSRFLKAHPAVRAFLENKYLGERLSIRLVYQALLRDLRSLEPECTRPPSYSAVRSYLQQVPKPLLILSREGERQFQERCEPYLLTDFESLVPNQIWVSDHGQHDVWVRNDLFSGVSTNAAVRPWLTAIIDMRSRKIVGTAWSASPSSHTISSALRVAIADFGIPQILLCG